MDGGTVNTAPPIDAATKAKWNKFIDFVQAQRLSNLNVLDQRNKQIGMGLLQKYNMANPKDALPINIIPHIQQEFQNVRQGAVADYQKNPAMFPDVKSSDEIMSSISPIDGWPGSKTLTHKFPVAVLTTNKDGVTSTQNFGTDVNAYKVQVGQKP